jgi:malonyl CoA-acyl carrier protein transacylase
MKIRLSRKIWQVVEIEVDLEQIDFDEAGEPETVRNVEDWVTMDDSHVAYTTVRDLVDEQIAEKADWVDEERVEHYLGDWEWEEPKKC